MFQHLTQNVCCCCIFCLYISYHLLCRRISMSCCTLPSRAITAKLTCWFAISMAALATVHMVYQRILLQAVLVKLQDRRETVSVIFSQVSCLLLPQICTVLNLAAVPPICITFLSCSCCIACLSKWRQVPLNGVDVLLCRCVDISK